MCNTRILDNAWHISIALVLLALNEYPTHYDIVGNYSTSTQGVPTPQIRLHQDAYTGIHAPLGQGDNAQTQHNGSTNIQEEMACLDNACRHTTL